MPLTCADAVDQALMCPSAAEVRLDAVEIATAEWVDWFNHRRLFEAHRQIPPAEFEEIHYRQQESSRQQAETQTKQPA